MDETMSDRAAPSKVSGPYVNGMVLDLTINWTFDTPSEERAILTIIRVLDRTLFPAMEVKWVSGSGEMRTAVLKLFDRRCAELFCGRYSAYHSPSVEACWQRYVQSGQAPELFKHIEKMDLEVGEGVWDLCPFSADEDIYDIWQSVDTWETTAKKEGRLQYRALQGWRSEIRAYEHLKKLQGKCVPLFYGTTSFSLAPPESGDEFFQVGGVLIQHIDGFILDDLFDIEEASPDVNYQDLIQRVVEVAEEVNKCGVINSECRPHNMIVQKGSMQPFEIGFDHCAFREDYESEEEYNDDVQCCGNPVGFGGVVAIRLNRVLKLGIKIKYGPWIRDG